MTFDSRLELRLWKELEGMRGRGEISFLRRQVRFPIVVEGRRVCAYVADYVFVFRGGIVIGDAKGLPTPLYALKKKLLAATRGLEIVEWHSLKGLREWVRACGSS